jgi:hypothetical protein
MKVFIAAFGRSLLVLVLIWVLQSGAIARNALTVCGTSEVPPSSGIWHSRQASRVFADRVHERLVRSLRRITGFNGLDFTRDGALVLGEEQKVSGGSRLARELIRAILATGDVFILEDYSQSPRVQFGQLDEGTRYMNLETGMYATIWRVRIDPEDFRTMDASPAVRQSFDEGFTVFHELLHGFGYDDALKVSEVGECESLLNEVRDELGLPRRAEYFGTYLPINSVTGTVRLRFAKVHANRTILRGRDEYLYYRADPVLLAEAACRARN